MAQLSRLVGVGPFTGWRGVSVLGSDKPFQLNAQCPAACGASRSVPLPSQELCPLQGSLFPRGVPSTLGGGISSEELLCYVDHLHALGLHQSLISVTRIVNVGCPVIPTVVAFWWGAGQTGSFLTTLLIIGS